MSDLRLALLLSDTIVILFELSNDNRFGDKITKSLTEISRATLKWQNFSRLQRFGVWRLPKCLLV